MKVHRFQALVIGGLCLGAAVLAGETYNQHQQLVELQAAARNVPADPAPALRRDIDALGNTLTTLQPQVAAMGDAQAQHASAQTTFSQQLEEMAASLKAVQVAPSGPSNTDFSALEQRLGKTEIALATLSARASTPPADTRPVAPVGQKTKAKAPAPPLTLLGIETRGAVRFVAALPTGALSLSTVHLLQPGDSLNGWQLRAIREDEAVFHVPGHGDRTLPLP
ncbi:hypothetical protein [Pseudomonas umsongensis]|uniref:hypothetical protein n=1 Tax=Pseudomonas umsongensis TaxID=198618 RepID=UPI00200B07A4|nr:hypothetical protein [Pseudomonas umsongensis]MCK8682632.1 hypothetical protein [Pseudomonas umsongensis]